MCSTGIIIPGSDPRLGIFNPCASPLAFNSIGAPSYPETAKLQAMTAAHCTPEYLAFLQNPNMHNFVNEFMGWDKEVLLARTLLRHSVPRGISSAIHYDKIFLRGGDPANGFLTTLVPIGDIAHDGGGLIYLKDSTDIG
jgi:phytanoyl-CoA hydroxylase